MCYNQSVMKKKLYQKFNSSVTIMIAILDNLIAIYQVKASPAGTAIQMCECKGAGLPFGNMLSQS